MMNTDIEAPTKARSSWKGIKFGSGHVAKTPAEQKTGKRGDRARARIARQEADEVRPQAPRDPAREDRVRANQIRRWETIERSAILSETQSGGNSVCLAYDPLVERYYVFWMNTNQLNREEPNWRILNIQPMSKGMFKLTAFDTPSPAKSDSNTHMGSGELIGRWINLQINKQKPARLRTPSKLTSSMTHAKEYEDSPEDCDFTPADLARLRGDGLHIPRMRG